VARCVNIPWPVPVELDYHRFPYSCPLRSRVSVTCSELQRNSISLESGWGQGDSNLIRLHSGDSITYVNNTYLMYVYELILPPDPLHVTEAFSAYRSITDQKYVRISLASQLVSHKCLITLDRSRCGRGQIGINTSARYKSWVLTLGVISIPSHKLLLPLQITNSSPATMQVSVSFFAHHGRRAHRIVCSQQIVQNVLVSQSSGCNCSPCECGAKWVFLLWFPLRGH